LKAHDPEIRAFKVKLMKKYQCILKKIVFVIGISVILAIHCYAQQLAFPTAEGYGKYSKGGRGGVVFEVTNLNDGGEGSLRAAVEAEGPRTVVFRVSGNIELESPIRIRNPYITIAGQTAPGDGICLKNHQLSIDADHVIIRHIRVRLGDLSGKDYDAIGGRYISNVILDHVSASWSVDECMSIYRCDSITVQWCIISESMFASNHVKGHHGFGGIWGGNNATYHHNLLAHHGSRNPRWASGVGYTDYRNNVIYNWGYNSCYGGEKIEDSYPDRYNFFTVNMVANYYKPGPATEPGKVSHRIASPAFDTENGLHGLWHVDANVMEGNPVVTSDNWNGGIQTSDDIRTLDKLKLGEPWPSMPIEQQTARDAYHSVLEKAGAVLPSRDPVDTRVIGEVRGGIATYEGSGYKQQKKVADPAVVCGIIDSQTDVGGWPELKSTPPPPDSDHDGMPDEWEDEQGLDRENPEDRNKLAPDGYTMLEKYLNSIR
jgi:pectate lyase